MKQQWEGKPIQVHTGLQNCIQSETYSRELAQWKEYLLQSAYDRLSVELGYQVFSSDEDGDVDDNEEN
ncbi:hypothetical protein ABBQ38_004828 [Trebouxia sp. C0009 RCD-2024]